ncbi:hypothetical protein KBC54_00265 [Patescibacteria group bacterium]|nr:hypothetical protein [Patescibacteria group bacterium]
MQKRTKLAIVIIVGLLLLLLGLYLLLSPYLAQRKALAPPAPTSDIPYVAGPKVVVPTSTSTPVAIPTATLQLRVLEDRAKATVERIGSGSSENGFLGTEDAMSDMTQSGAIEIRAAQQTMQQAHPASGPLFGISTRVVSSHAENGVIGDASILVSVDAIQYENVGASNAPSRIQGKQVKVTFMRQPSGGYLIDHLEWTDIAL